MEIKKGDRGVIVKMIQQALFLLDDGIFGDITEKRIKEYQRKYGLKDDGIVGERTWGAMVKYGHVENIKKSRRNIREIIVHCTATPEGRNVSVAEITAWHKARHFTTIGYHYVVHRNGVVEQGRDVNVSGAHCEGHNTYSIGVVYVGGCANDGKLTPKDTRTREQKEALRTLLKMLKDIYRGAKVYGHRDFAKKACPSFDATREYRDL